MARRTKENALATRDSLLDAAELLFQAQGVSNTSLNDIAKQAGTSRGAIYWHFKDKANLFNAMMERATLPLEEAFDARDQHGPENALAQIRSGMCTCMARIATDERMRRIFEVLTHKVEYVEELQVVRARHLTVRNEFLSKMELGLARAASEQNMQLPIAAAAAAHGLHAMMDGLIQNWLLDPQSLELVSTCEQVIDIYLAGLGFKLVQV